VNEFIFLVRCLPPVSQKCTQGDHLLMHDDVIGTRIISFIVYLTDSPWTKEDGGLLEL